MPLRIALDIRHIRDYGIGSYIRNLIAALDRRSDDHAYILAGRRQDLHELPPLSPRFARAEFPRSDAGLANQATFPWFLRRFRPDLSHIPLNSVALLLEKPYVVTVHDMSSLLFPQDRASRVGALRHRYRLFRFRRGLLRANRIIAVSQATQRDLESLLGIPPDRIRQIYGAVDTRYLEAFVPADARAAGPHAAEFHRRRLQERYQIHHPYLLYAGTIRPQKNIPKLIEAFAVLRAELAGHPALSELRLLVIGDAISKYPDVRRAVVNARLEPYVRFFGFVSADALRAFYEGAQAFVFPSLYEGFGLPPLEAMAVGTPVVASNLSSLPEAVGDAAEPVNPENVFDIVRGIREVLLNTSHRELLIQRGYAQVRRFHWDRTAAEVMAVYEEVGQKRRQSSH